METAGPAREDRSTTAAASSSKPEEGEGWAFGGHKRKGRRAGEKGDLNRGGGGLLEQGSL